jgi:tRNA-specific 2-thiouridylase
VLDVSPVTRTITVGPAEALEVTAVTGNRAVWHVPPPAGVLECRAQLRSHGAPVPARVSADEHAVQVELLEPVRGVASGQAVVLYASDPERGDLVLGAATVTATRRGDGAAVAGATAGSPGPRP